MTSSIAARAAGSVRVHDQHVAVARGASLSADRMVDQPLEEAHLARADHDQVRLPLLRELDDRVGDIADGDW